MQHEMQHETVKIADMLFAAALPAAPGLLTAKRRGLLTAKRRGLLTAKRGLPAAKRGLPAAKRFRQAAKLRKGEKMRASPLDARALLC